jgi:PKD repeat protein
MLVQFNSTAASPAGEHFSSWKWDFDDGTTTTVTWAEKTQETINPRHTYAVFRDHFDVCLEVTTICGKANRYCDRVSVHCTKPVAGFSVDKTDGAAPLTVRITDTSRHTPETETAWTYRKDGTIFSSEKNPPYTFSDPGTFTLTQIVKKNCNPESDTATRQITVREPLKVYTVMNLSIPTTTPTIGIVGMYFNLSNTSGATPTATTPPAAVTATVSRGTTTRVAAVTPATTTAPAIAPAGSGPGAGTLMVASDPGGAEVYVDDVLRGASPVSLSGMSAGSHTIRLVKEGYEPMIVPVDISAGRTTEYSTSLVPVAKGTGILPLLAGAILILALAAGGGYLVMKNRKSPEMKP